MEKECIFCKIARKEIPAEVIYEDDNIMAFLDVSPVNRGHTLVIPKEHHTNILETPDDILSKLIIAIKKISKSVMKAMNADGFNIGINNFKAAGQIVMHTHIHVVPRFKDDGLKLWPGKEYNQGEIKEIAGKIRNEINKY